MIQSSRQKLISSLKIHLQKNRTARYLISFLIIGLGIAWSYDNFRNVYLADLFEQSENRLAIYRGTLDGVVNRYAYLPYVLAKDDHVLNALENGQTQDLNRRLSALQKQSGAAALYLMTASGDTIASSNWQDPTSFIGNNYAFRPYFKDAKLIGSGSFYAIGVTTHTPGIFISHKVPETGTPKGVAVVKVDLRPVEKTWSDQNETVFVTDSRGVVLLSSRKDWRYGSLFPLSQDVVQQMAVDRQFQGVDHKPLPLTKGSLAISGEVGLEGVSYLHRTAPVGYSSWRIHYLTPIEPALVRARYAIAIEIALLSILLAAGFFFRSQALKRTSIQLRNDATELRGLNLRLETEVDERKKTEEDLRIAQNDLIQTSKLATLGHMATAIVHELNQPLAAARTFTAGLRHLLENNMLNDAGQNVDRIDNLLKRMSFITRELKSFARRSDDVLRPVSLQDALASSLAISRPRLKTFGIKLSLIQPSLPVMVFGDQVRIEQVLLNIIQNATDAMSDTTSKNLTISLEERDNQAILVIRDTGIGLPKDNQDRLQEPFFTTKEQGEGLGLGLAISATILSDLNGKMIATDHPNGGAEFTISLPLHATGRNLENIP